MKKMLQTGIIGGVVRCGLWRIVVLRCATMSHLVPSCPILSELEAGGG